MGMHVPPIRQNTSKLISRGIQVQVIQVMTSRPTSILCGCWIGGACDSPRARRSLLRTPQCSLICGPDLRPLPCSVVRHMQTQQTRPPIFSPAQLLILKRLFARVASRHYMKTMSRLLLVALLAVLGVASGFVAGELPRPFLCIRHFSFISARSSPSVAVWLLHVMSWAAEFMQEDKAASIVDGPPWHHS